MNSTKQVFKAGDKVYYPIKSNKIYTLKKNPKASSFPVKVKHGLIETAFTLEGKDVRYDMNPSIFHATKENCAKLSALYSVQFEEPKSFLDTHLEKGSRVLCLIVQSTSSELPKYIWEVKFDKYFVDVIVGKIVDNVYLTQDTSYVEADKIYPIAIDDKGKITYLD